MTETLSKSILITDREKRLLRRMARGKTDHAIAVQIGGTEEQITEQRLALMRKLRRAGPLRSRWLLHDLKSPSIQLPHDRACQMRAPLA